VGVITRVAGTTGTAGSSGDDGLAIDAQLNRPSGVAVTADGGFLIADTDNQVIRKVESIG
jgi:NHL repeat